MDCDECLTGDKLYISDRALMFGPRSLREVDLGVSDCGCCDPYEKRFLWGVEGVRLGPDRIEPLVGGVFDLEPGPSWDCGIACGTSSLNISDRSSVEYVRFASLFWKFSSVECTFFALFDGVAGDPSSCSRL